MSLFKLVSLLVVLFFGAEAQAQCHFSEPSPSQACCEAHMEFYSEAQCGQYWPAEEEGLFDGLIGWWCEVTNGLFCDDSESDSGGEGGNNGGESNDSTNTGTNSGPGGFIYNPGSGGGSEYACQDQCFAVCMTNSCTDGCVEYCASVTEL